MELSSDWMVGFDWNRVVRAWDTGRGLSLKPGFSLFKKGSYTFPGIFCL